MAQAKSDPLDVFINVLCLSLAILAMEHLAMAFSAFFHRVSIAVVFFPRSLSIARSWQMNRCGMVCLGFSDVD